MARRIYSSSKKKNSRKRKSKYKKYSINDRVAYYRSKPGKENRVFAEGFVDGVSGAHIDSSLHEGYEDYYFAGVEKGDKVKDRSRNIKF